MRLCQLLDWLSHKCKPNMNGVYAAAFPSALPSELTADTQRANKLVETVGGLKVTEPSAEFEPTDTFVIRAMTPSGAQPARPDMVQSLADAFPATAICSPDNVELTPDTLEAVQLTRAELVGEIEEGAITDTIAVNGAVAHCENMRMKKRFEAGRADEDQRVAERNGLLGNAAADGTINLLEQVEFKARR